MKLSVLLLQLLCSFQAGCWTSTTVHALQNGAAITPAMGWISWQRYNCAKGCKNATADDCLNEKLIRDTADAMVSLGYKEAGYEYVCIDDC
eukprot:gene20645-35323_t